MRLRALLTAGCFLALALIATLVVASVTRPSMAGVLVATVLLATAAGGAGLLHRRAWPLAALLLLPLGAYLLARFQIALPAETEGVRAQASFYAARIGSGVALYNRETFPLDGGAASLRLLVSLTVYAVVGAAAFLALSLRRPLPAIVILLCLAGLGFTTDEAARQPLAAVAFVVSAGGLLALTRPRQREHVRAADAVAGGVTAVVAALLAFSVLGATSVEAGRPLQDWRAWNLVGPGTELMRFDWMQNYPRLLEREGDAVVMEVRSPIASYWRANTLSQFDGAAWRGTPDAFPLQPRFREGLWTYEVRSKGALPGRTVTQRFSVRNTFTDHLFAGGAPIEVSSTLPLDLSTSDAGAVSVDPPRGPKLTYSITASVPDLAPMDLIGRGTYYPPEVEDEYLDLPFAARPAGDGPGAAERWESRVGAAPWGSEWAGLYRLNERVVGAQTDPYRIALAIQQYLRANYDYSLTPPSSDYASPYAAFLFQTYSGYCQQFAGSMAVLLRFNGIPARVAVGFTQGQEEREGVFVVRRQNAHAWVEAYFPGTGWAPFDPTPGRSLPASADVTPDGQSAASSAEASGGAGAAGLRDLPGRARVNDPGGPGDGGAASVQPPDRRPWLLLAPIGLLLWPVGRALLRRRALFGGTPDERLRTSVGLLYAVLRDHGVDVPASQTLDETAQLLRKRFGVDAGDVPARVQAVLFGSRTATDADVAAVRALESRLRASLRSRDGRLASLAAAYGLRRVRPAQA